MLSDELRCYAVAMAGWGQRPYSGTVLVANLVLGRTNLCQRNFVSGRAFVDQLVEGGAEVQVTQIRLHGETVLQCLAGIVLGSCHQCLVKMSSLSDSLGLEECKERKKQYCH